ncbi:DUF262 domain-containing protein [Natranaerobius thermophilus]|uniref:DUF262 domain-containing protein n=1 Tax=Natranaerobius thermophilus (strain ATCC BAA-1301 / DSM 18059 / JW/NM-WN-LF) TaxID=457570 RepID=B2A7U8_NATTJ|nr:DUF262 domain-containing protein [Natranaerobius thermophilus]ACB84396.1 protein of unknown function DUF262 [Natranaerobius thermophilus JW/NM-WN-LF]
MDNSNIKAGEIYVNDLLGEKYLFNIPDYQRPFSWEKENFEQLCEDIHSFIEPVYEILKEKDHYQDGIEPYFIGSVILCNNEDSSASSGIYDIIDGQQRLTSFTILMAVMRDLTENNDAEQALQRYIYQKGNEFIGTRERIKLSVREREFDFYRNNILTVDATWELLEMATSGLTEPKIRMIEATKVFHNFFKDEDGQVDQEYLDVFIKYFLQKVVLVVVRTDSLSSAFRLFNVINARGLPLTNADLLKSENLRVIPSERREKYTEKWESIEEEFGSEDLEMLIRFIRSIKLKKKADRAVSEEFNRKVFPENPNLKGEHFIDYLELISDLYGRRILDGNLSSMDVRKNAYFYNLISIMKNFLPFDDWMTALIKFDETYQDEDKLYEFLIKYEKKIVVDWITRLSFTERLTRIYKVIELIEEFPNDPNTILRHSLLNQDVSNQKDAFKDSLNDINFYKIGRYQISKYVLLRLDMESRDNNSLREYMKNVSVEHILPRNPRESYWLDRFSQNDRIEWTNRLGNLVLLEGRKNSKASNKAFYNKVNEYFEKKSDFHITNELQDYTDWTLDKLENRHKQLIDRALDIWVH